MFTNVFAQSITDENGYISTKKVETLVPGNTEVSNALAHTTQLLARTALDEKFIELNFNVLPFDVVIQHNRIAEHIIMQNINIIQDEISRDVLTGDTDLLMHILTLQYPEYVNEAIIGKCISVLSHALTLTEDVIEEFTTVINVYVDAVSKEFVLENIDDFSYNLLTAALKRKDITREEVMDNLDDILLSEVMTWMFEFVDLTPAEEAEEVDFRTAENKQLLIDLFIIKSKEA